MTVSHNAISQIPCSDMQKFPSLQTAEEHDRSFDDQVLSWASSHSKVIAIVIGQCQCASKSGCGLGARIFKGAPSGSTGRDQ